MVDANRRRLTVGMVDKTVAPRTAGGGYSYGALLAEEIDKTIGGKDNVTLIHSVTDSEMKKKKSFGEKDRAGWVGGKFCQGGAAMEVKLDNVDMTCKKGLKPESPNQDSFIVASCPGKWGLYGVFDGHGPNGHDTSDFAVKTLVYKFLNDDKFISNTADAFTRTFVATQVDIEAQQTDKGLDSSSSGSTCTMAFHNVETDILTIAHVGDSRAVVYKQDPATKETQMAVVKETEDHKPDLPAEKARIEKMGGRVVFDGYYNHRVFAKAGMYPGLNMSRALGDIVAHKEAGLTAEPEINIVELKPLRSSSPLTLIIASDGVWEFIASDGKCASESRKVDLKDVQKLAKESWDAWMKDSDSEISDDISVVKVIL